MRKIKLLLLACAIFGGASQMFAQQTDVTTTYLTNAVFSIGTPIDNNVCTYGKDMEANGTTYYGAQAIPGWTNVSVGAEDSGYENSKLAGALFAYGSTPWLAGTGTVAPTTDPEGQAGNAAGLCAVWGGSVQYTQDVTLPAGSYTVRFKVYNATAGSGNSSGVITKDLFGFKADAGTEYYAPNNTFAIGQWSTIAVSFNLTEETAGKISMGYVGPSGNAAMPHLFVDNVKILKNEMFEDCTSKVNSSGWTGATDGYQGGTINTAREYGNKAVGRHIYQTVSGLDNGTYEVALYSISQKEWNGTLASDAGDVAYVFAEGASELNEWINARSRNSYPGDENVGIYTISDVRVTDGTLTLGMGLAKADLTEWHHVQIKSLVRTNGIDLSDLILAYNNALTAAKAVDQSKTMASSIKTALNNAIETYDAGKVDTGDADALEAAAAALKTATNNAETSIASYAIIASGKVATNVLDGWTCTNTNTFHINTWSSEGNPGNDPSGMTTPFIENWRSKTDNAGLGEGVFSYTLEGIEPGEVYYAKALIRSYNERNSDVPNGPTFFVNDAETSLATEGTTFTYNGMSGIYATLGAAATVGVDGKITLGAKIAADANYNWVAFKDVSIQPMSVALATAVSEAEALYTSLPTAAKNTLKAVVDANKDDSGFSTAADYETAIGKINTAKDVASSFMSPYSAWLTVKSEAETLFASYEAMLTLTGTNSTAVENADDPAIITAKKDEIQNAINAYGVYTENAPIATALGVSVADVTSYSTVEALQKGVEDLIVAAYTAADAYALDMTSQLGAWENAPGKNHGESWNGTTGDGSDDYYDEYNKADRAMSQTVTLPAGDYVLIAKGRASVNGLLTLTDGTNTVTFPHKSSTGRGIATDGTATYDAGATYANENNGRGWEYRYLTFTSDGTTPITLTFNWKTSDYQWAGLDDIVLKRKTALSIDEDADYDTAQEGAGEVTLTRTIKANTWNTIWLPFSMTAAELKSTFGDDVAIAEYSETAVGDASTVTFTKMETPSISANTPVLLKTSTAGTSYTIPDRTVVAGTPVVAGSGNFDFVGITDASATIDAGNYFISANKLYKSSGATTIKGTRAFIAAKDPGAHIANFYIDGIETTAIEGLEISNINSGKIYNLNGQEVKNAQKGIYIMNGKKVIK